MYTLAKDSYISHVGAKDSTVGTKMDKRRKISLGFPYCKFPRLQCLL